MSLPFRQMLHRHQTRLGWRQKEMRIWLGDIPLGTYQSWIKNQSEPPQWTQFLIEEKLKSADPDSMVYAKPSARQLR